MKALPFLTAREIALRAMRSQLAKAEARAIMTSQFSDVLAVLTLRQEIADIVRGAP